MKELDAMYARIGDEMRAQYTLGYVSSNVAEERLLAQGEHPPHSPRPGAPGRPHQGRLLRPSGNRDR